MADPKTQSGCEWVTDRVNDWGPMLCGSRHLAGPDPRNSDRWSPLCRRHLDAALDQLGLTDPPPSDDNGSRT